MEKDNVIEVLNKQYLTNLDQIVKINIKGEENVGMSKLGILINYGEKE